MNEAAKTRLRALVVEWRDKADRIENGDAVGCEQEHWRASARALAGVLNELSAQEAETVTSDGVMSRLNSLVKAWREKTEATHVEVATVFGLALAVKQLEEVIGELMASSLQRDVNAQYTCSFCHVKGEGSCINIKCPIGYHNIWTLRGEEATDGHDPLRSVSCRNFALGDVEAWEKIGKRLREDACKAFADCKDERALWLRNLAHEMDEIGLEKRDSYNYEYEITEKG